MDYLNFSGVMRLLPLFLLEGVKTFYRISYAILKTLRLEILDINNPEDIIKVIRKKSKEIKDLNKLFNHAYSYKLNRNNNKYIFQNSFENDAFNNKNTYYLPRFCETNFLSNEEFLKMWSLLPLIFRPNDLKKIYDANIDGFSLRKIYNLAENYQMGQGLIFLLETTNNEAFGGLLSNFLSLTGGKFIRPIEAYLISIRPFQQVNSIQQKTDNILRCDQESIMYGNGNDGPAIYIKGDLHSGISNPNNCFSRERLTKNDNGLF